MTCIVGAVSDGVVVIGADSMVSAGCAYDTRRNPKVAKVGPLLIGVSGEPRVTDIVQYWLQPPPFSVQPSDPHVLRVKDATRYMVCEFIPALRAVLEEHGVFSAPTPEGNSWAMLVGVCGRLLAVYDDFQVEETRRPYHAVGCGARAALGALYVLMTPHVGMPASAIVETALQAAAANDVHVCAPFVIEELGERV